MIMATHNKDQTQHATEAAIDAVVIGASAGGIEALLTVLGALPPDFPVPILIVLHLPADQPSSLAELFARRCALAVKEGEDKEPIGAGTVYLAPPGYHLLVEPERCLSLSLDEPRHFSRPSIDALFESAAYVYRQRLLGIILTGASADGAEGVRNMRDFGGQVWVQEPEDAAAPTMPAAAIEAAGADRILPLAQIGAALAQHVIHPNTAGHD